MAGTDNDELEPGLRAAADAVARLSQPVPPVGLAERTVNRVVRECAPFKKVFWLFRPITHPLARVAAAAAIIYTLSPLTDIDQAEPLGRRIEERVFGRQLVDSMERVVDGLLALRATNSWRQEELDAMMQAPYMQPPSQIQRLQMQWKALPRPTESQRETGNWA